MSSPVAESTQPDVLIVGGGSAGAALAARLSEDANRRVLPGRPRVCQLTSPRNRLTGAYKSDGLPHS